MNQQLVKRNLSICEEAVGLRNKLETGFLALGKILKQIRDEKCYEPNYENLEDFCWDQLKISKSTASRLINVFEVFVLTYKVSSTKLTKVGWSVLAETLPVIKSKDDANAWVEKASLLTQTDIRRELKEAKTGVSMIKCEHKDSEIISFRICHDCGLRERVYEDDK